MNKLKWKVAQWFELRWWRGYLRGKDKAEYLAWKREYWGGILEKCGVSAESRGGDSAGGALNDNKTICDLGCGPAGVFIALPNIKVTAVDPLIDAYEKQTPFFSKSDYPNVKFVKSTIEDFETFEVLKTSDVYDVVFCMNAINHVHDIEKGFEKLAAVCATGGTLVVSIDAHNYSFFKYLFRLIPGDVLHPHQYDLEEYKAFIEKQGMRIVKTELLKQERIFNHYLLVAELFA